MKNSLYLNQTQDHIHTVNHRWHTLHCTSKDWFHFIYDWFRTILRSKSQVTKCAM